MPYMASRNFGGESTSDGVVILVVLVLIVSGFTSPLPRATLRENDGESKRTRCDEHGSIQVGMYMLSSGPGTGRRPKPSMRQANQMKATRREEPSHGWRGVRRVRTHAVATPLRSSTFKSELQETGENAGEPKVFEVDYGSGSVLGLEGRDDVLLAGMSLSQVIFGLVLYEDQQVKRFLIAPGLVRSWALPLSREALIG